MHFLGDGEIKKSKAIVTSNIKFLLLSSLGIHSDGVLHTEALLESCLKKNTGNGKKGGKQD